MRFGRGIILRLHDCLGPPQTLEGLSLCDVQLRRPIHVVAQDAITQGVDTLGLCAPEFAARQRCCVFIEAQAFHARLEDIPFFLSSKPQRLLKH